jgi:hypothetical protein
MAQFDRFDICEAYLALEMDFNVGGWLRERASCRWRSESVGVQLARMGFKPGCSWDGYESLSENGKEIYDAFCDAHGLTRVRTETLTLPSYLASALINGDTSGLEPEDMQWLAAAEKMVAESGSHITLDNDAEPYFASSYACDLPGYRLAGDFLDFTLVYR